MYLLDTNVCIHLLNQRHAGIEQNFRSHSPSEIALCSIVKAELLFGARHSQRVSANLQRSKQFFAPLTSVPFPFQAFHGIIESDDNVYLMEFYCYE